jgi:hypothetical protein
MKTNVKAKGKRQKELFPFCLLPSAFSLVWFARGAGTPRTGTRTPPPPQGGPAVEKRPLDDGREIRAHAAAPLELAQHLVVVVDDFQVDRRLQLLDRTRVEAVPAADELDHLIDDGEMVEELSFE